MARTNNNGMGNNFRVDGRVWGAVDIFKGSGEAGFIWSLVWTRNAGNRSLMEIDGFWDSVRLRQLNVVGPQILLEDGWNQVVVMNDVNACPNITMWLNGVLVDQIHGGGEAMEAGARLQKAALTKKNRGAGPFPGSMHFDNVYGGNEPPAFFQPVGPFGCPKVDETIHFTVPDACFSLKAKCKGLNEDASIMASLAGR